MLANPEIEQDKVLLIEKKYLTIAVIKKPKKNVIRIMTKNKKPFEISLKSNSQNILIEISKPCDVKQIKLVYKLIKIISDAVKNEDIK